MGSTISSVFQQLFVRRFNISVVGLGAAGKTTVMKKLNPNEIPIPGAFGAEVFRYKNIRFTVWDVGGQDNIRRRRRLYTFYAEAIIFVIDSSNRECAGEAREELQYILSKAEYRDTILLVFANKQDLPNAMNTAEITDKLDLHSLGNHQWYIQAACATTGDGILEGLEWVLNQLKNME